MTKMALYLYEVLEVVQVHASKVMTGSFCFVRTGTS